MAIFSLSGNEIGSISQIKVLFVADGMEEVEDEDVVGMQVGEVVGISVGAHVGVCVDCNVGSTVGM